MDLEDLRLMHQWMLFQANIGLLIHAWRRELDALRLEYETLFNPLTEHEVKVFEDAREAAWC